MSKIVNGAVFGKTERLKPFDEDVDHCHAELRVNRRTDHLSLSTGKQTKLSVPK